MAELTPMMQQYLRIKQEHPNCIIFYRVGDFYEMFFDDAKVASRELELVLTGKDCGLEERAPMCGVPFHAYENYAAKLVSRGYKVGICEQLEDPSTAKGPVKRGVIRIITPGTVLENSMLDEGRNNYLCALYVRGDEAGICFADISTGEMLATCIAESVEQKIKSEISRYSPREIIMNSEAQKLGRLKLFIEERTDCALEIMDEQDFEPSVCAARINSVLEGRIGELAEHPLALSAAGAVIEYVEKTQKAGVSQLRNIEYYYDGQYMTLDFTARRNLELTETMRSKDKRGSLLWVLDRTKTAMGKRLIRTWLEHPLLSCAGIIRRQNAVEELISKPIERSEIAEVLAGIHDLERIMSRVAYGSVNPREMLALSSAFGRLPSVLEKLEGMQSAMLCDIRGQIDTLSDIKILIDLAIDPEAPMTVREGGIIKDGFSAEVDILRADMKGGKDVIARIEQSEREKTGIPKLKVGYNRVFGYYIEVSNSYKELVPQEYIRKQTLTNCERYITQELKDLEARILGASGKIVVLEYSLFDEIRKKTAAQIDRIKRTAQAIAKLDVLYSFAQTSFERSYVRPEVNISGKIVLKDSRHPVVEALSDSPFVPNDAVLDKAENRVAIITGPNMAGKSTFMRQVALITLMAQTGCFVPASYAEVGIVDRIFTRVGASDDLTSGQSTFMVEMSEVADILKSATADSLLILDEIGRGTSTYDGMSIARAVLEYAADTKKLGAKTLFATHYHELTALEEILDGVKNYNIAVKKHGDDITFLRRIIRGGADDSYGIEVAKLAGVPMPVINRAKQILKSLEAGTEVATRKTKKDKNYETDGQITFVSSVENELSAKLKGLDVNTMTPIEALGVLFELSKMAKEQDN